MVGLQACAARLHGSGTSTSSTLGPSTRRLAVSAWPITMDQSMSSSLKRTGTRKSPAQVSVSDGCGYLKPVPAAVIVRPAVLVDRV
jgi:hypothetical protein